MQPNLCSMLANLISCSKPLHTSTRSAKDDSLQKCVPGHAGRASQAREPLRLDSVGGCLWAASQQQSRNPSVGRATLKCFQLSTLYCYLLLPLNSAHPWPTQESLTKASDFLLCPAPPGSPVNSTRWVLSRGNTSQPTASCSSCPNVLPLMGFFIIIIIFHVYAWRAWKRRMAETEANRSPPKASLCVGPSAAGSGLCTADTALSK